MNKEIVLDKNSMIVSETDMQGNITYANHDFCKICGYTKEELIGKPHNIIRHPDMPKVAFKDLWDTICKNEVWKGIVKNKTRDGNFYWVNATAYHVNKENGEKRYISIRVKPTKEEINKAQELYTKLNSK